MMTNYHLTQLFILNFSKIIELFTFSHLVNLYIQYIIVCDFISLSGMTIGRLWLHLCLHSCPGPWAQLHPARPLLQKCLLILSATPAEGSANHNWFLLSLGRASRWIAGCRAASLASLSSSLVLPSQFANDVVQCTDFSDMFVHWAENLLFNYSCSNGWNFKGRGQGDLSLCYLSDVMPWVTFNERFSSTFS